LRENRLEKPVVPERLAALGPVEEFIQSVPLLRGEFILTEAKEEFLDVFVHGV
jgi:hypothetical protein